MNIVPYNQHQAHPNGQYPSYPNTYSANATYPPVANGYAAANGLGYGGYNTQLTAYPANHASYPAGVGQGVGYSYPAPALPVNFLPPNQTMYPGGGEVMVVRRRRSMTDLDERYDSRHRREREREERYWREKERLRGEMEGYRRGIEDARGGPRRDYRDEYGYSRDRRPVDREIACAVM